MRTTAAALSVALGVCLLLLWKPASQRAADLAPYAIGDIVALEHLQTVDGEPIAETDLRASASHGLVVQFWSARCPVSRGYDERLEQLVRDHERDGRIDVVRIAAVPDESAAEIRAAHGQDIPLLVDGSRRLTERLDVHTTPHFVVLDARGALVYSGAFDANLLGDVPAEQAYVERAIEHLLSGTPLLIDRTPTFGTRLGHASASAE